MGRSLSDHFGTLTFGAKEEGIRDVTWAVSELGTEVEATQARISSIALPSDLARLSVIFWA